MMGDHFVLLVDRLLTESTLESAIESRNQLLQATASAVEDTKFETSSQTIDFGSMSTPGKLVECRICQDEDEGTKMETPCSCCGSLKYAHRRCIQRWCNEKGNTTCEICNQEFKPGYTAPPPLFQLSRIPMNFRGSWQTSRRDVRGPQFIAMVSTDHNFLNPHYEGYSTSTMRNSFCCRSIAVALMIFLILRHTLPLVQSGTNDVSFPLFALIFLRMAGVILPIYVMVRAVTLLQHRRHQQVRSDQEPSSFTSVGEEDEPSNLEAPPHVFSVH
uniref:Uncharacterized protein LOC105636893 n=1 Tax=Rhizophora mucronata TaxID=61149 RepID=A0A2P2IQI6_RHIMU